MFLLWSAKWVPCIIGEGTSDQGPISQTIINKKSKENHQKNDQS